MFSFLVEAKLGGVGEGDSLDRLRVQKQRQDLVLQQVSRIENRSGIEVYLRQSLQDSCDREESDM